MKEHDNFLNGLSAVIMALMMAFMATTVMLNEQVSDLSEEGKASSTLPHQDEYQIQYGVDFFFSQPYGEAYVYDSATSSDGTTYLVGSLEGTDWQFGEFSGTAGSESKGFVAAFSRWGGCHWVMVDASQSGHSSLNAIDLTSDGSLIAVGEFSVNTSWGSNWALASGDSQSPFAVKIDSDGNTDWLSVLGGQQASHIGYAHDLIVDSDVVYATGTYTGRLMPPGLSPIVADSAGDAFVVKFSAADGSVSHITDGCSNCNTDPDVTPKEVGESITVLGGSILVGASYDKTTSFGGIATATMNEGAATNPHSDVAVWKLSNTLGTTALSTSTSTSGTDTVVGIEALSSSEIFLATNSDTGAGGRLLELDSSFQLIDEHAATDGYLLLLDITVDSGNLELVGFGGYSGDAQTALTYEGVSYNPDPSTAPNSHPSSLFVAEFSGEGYQYGQLMDLPPTHVMELNAMPGTTSITAQGGSIHVISISRPVFTFGGPEPVEIPQGIAFAGTQMTVRGGIGMVAHFEWDADQDGIPNRLDVSDDEDNDGWSTTQEQLFGSSDNDNTSTPKTVLDDLQLLYNQLYQLYNDSQITDEDGDGWSDVQEEVFGSSDNDITSTPKSVLDALQQLYDEMVEDYENLLSDYDDLLANYNSSQAEYDALLVLYNALLSDYEDSLGCNDCNCGGPDCPPDMDSDDDGWSDQIEKACDSDHTNGSITPDDSEIDTGICWELDDADGDGVRNMDDQCPNGESATQPAVGCFIPCPTCESFKETGGTDDEDEINITGSGEVADLTVIGGAGLIVGIGISSILGQAARGTSMLRPSSPKGGPGKRKKGGLKFGLDDLLDAKDVVDFVGDMAPGMAGTISVLNLRDEFVFVGHKASFAEAAGVLAASSWSGGGNAILIRDKKNKGVAGVITQQRFLQTCSTSINLKKTKVSKHMLTNILHLQDDTTMENAVRFMGEKNPDAVVILNREGTFVGYLSPSDYREALGKIKLAKSGELQSRSGSDHYIRPGVERQQGMRDDVVWDDSLEGDEV